MLIGSLPRNIVRQTFDLVVRKFMGNPVHYRVRTVGAFVLSEINELSANVVLLLATNHREHRGVRGQAFAIYTVAIDAGNYSSG